MNKFWFVFWEALNIRKWFDYSVNGLFAILGFCSGALLINHIWEIPFMLWLSHVALVMASLGVITGVLKHFFPPERKN